MSLLQTLGLVVLLLLAPAAIAAPVSPPHTAAEIATEILAPLLNPTKIAALKGDRPVNVRLYRIMGWLETARLCGWELESTITGAQSAARYHGTVIASADRRALLRSWTILNRMGCFTPENILRMKRGRSPVITRGKHAGELVHLDHILPRALVPELAARFYNLEPVPSRANLTKGSRITAEEMKRARRWHRDGLLSKAGLLAVEHAYRQGKGTADLVATVK